MVSEHAGSSRKARRSRLAYAGTGCSRATRLLRSSDSAPPRVGSQTGANIVPRPLVSVGTVHNDLEVLREGWREEAQVATADHVALDLQRLAELLLALRNAA